MVRKSFDRKDFGDQRVGVGSMSLGISEMGKWYFNTIVKDGVWTATGWRWAETTLEIGMAIG